MLGEIVSHVNVAFFHYLASPAEKQSRNFLLTHI